MQFYPKGEGFLGPDGGVIAPEDAKVVVIPFGLEMTVSYGSGTAQGPAAMIEASQEMEMFDDEFWCEPVAKYGVATMVAEEIQKPITKALSQLEGLVESVLAQNKFPMVFGGEHSLTAGAIRPFARRYDDLVILHFDAHADLRDGYLGEPYSHAAALRRVVDQPGHEHLKLLSFGIRNISKGEIPYLESNPERIRIFWAREKKEWDLAKAAEWLRGKSVYVSFDVDGLDASLMPATGTPEPGGLFWDDVMPVLKLAAENGTIVGADVVELAPIEHWHAPDFTAAKLAYKILNYAFMSPLP
jgi:agmatinase